MGFIEKATSRMVSHQSFEYNSFPKAKKTTIIDGICICFDRITLYIYFCTLSQKRKRLLQYAIEQHLEKTLTYEKNKERGEYRTLLEYLRIEGSYKSATFEKAIQPDFVLQDKKRIGLELTAFKTREVGELESFAKANFGKGKNAKEIQTNVRKCYKRREEQYDFFQVNDTVCIASKLVDTNDCWTGYAEIISKKYKKYKDKYQQFDCFILLCDARFSVAMSNADEIEWVINLAKNITPTSGGFDLHILYTDGNNTKIHRSCL